jgi:hypothetical protein
MKKHIVKFYIIACYLCSSVVAIAQPGDNDGGGGLETPDPIGTPIDDYIWILLAVGFAYVFFRIRGFDTKLKAPRV